MSFHTKGQLIDILVANGLKASTSRIYATSLLRIYSMVQGSEAKAIPDSVGWINPPLVDKIMDQPEKTAASIRNDLSALIAYLKLKGKSNSDVFKYASMARDKKHKIYEKDYTSGVWNPVEQAKKIPFEELAQGYDKLIRELDGTYKMLSSKPSNIDLTTIDRKTYIHIRNSVIGAFYLYSFKYPDDNFGVQRNEALSTLVVGNPRLYNSKTLEKGENMVLVLTKPNSQAKLVYFDSKIQKLGDDPIILLAPVELSKLLRSWIKMNHLNVGESLFSLRSAEFTGILQKLGVRLFDSRIGVQLLRKIYVSHKFGDYKKEMAEVSGNMMHSAETEQRFYTKSESS